PVATNRSPLRSSTTSQTCVASRLASSLSRRDSRSDPSLLTTVWWNWALSWWPALWWCQTFNLAARAGGGDDPHRQREHRQKTPREKSRGLTRDRIMSGSP